MRDPARPKIFILGATGTLGRFLVEELGGCFSVAAPKPRRGMPFEAAGMEWLSPSLDATKPAGLDELFRRAEPDVVINCIGTRASLESNPDVVSVIEVNSIFPHVAQRAAHAVNARIIHISTDGVFSGRRGFYKEVDVPDASDLYGRSKLLGELSGPAAMTLRTTFFGPTPTGRGLVEWLLRERGNRIDGYEKYIFSPLSLIALAGLISRVISRPDLSGVYHAGGPRLSKYELLCRLSEALRLQVTVRPVLQPTLDRSLVSSRIWTELGFEPPGIETIVADTVQHITRRTPSCNPK